jgi:dihydroorotate dehydrogenase (fumarate)
MDQEKMYFWYPEAVDYVNEYAKEGGVQEYLELIKECKKAVEIPVIASINCITSKDWPAFSKKLRKQEQMESN